MGALGVLAGNSASLVAKAAAKDADRDVIREKHLNHQRGWAVGSQAWPPWASPGLRWLRPRAETRVMAPNPSFLDLLLAQEPANWDYWVMRVS